MRQIIYIFNPCVPNESEYSRQSSNIQPLLYFEKNTMTNIKSRVDNSFKKTAEFFTPHEVGEYIYACCQFPDGPSDAKIYDPTC